MSGVQGLKASLHTLFKDIIKEHKRLPKELRELGNSYVQEEFEQHKDANTGQLKQFYNKWSEYLNLLRKNNLEGVLSQSVSKDLQQLNEEQKKINGTSERRSI